MNSVNKITVCVSKQIRNTASFLAKCITITTVLIQTSDAAGSGCPVQKPSNPIEAIQYFIDPTSRVDLLCEEQLLLNNAYLSADQVYYQTKNSDKTFRHAVSKDITKPLTLTSEDLAPQTYSRIGPYERSQINTLKGYTTIVDTN
jgi:hypothetical protein